MVQESPPGARCPAERPPAAWFSADRMKQDRRSWPSPGWMNVGNHLAVLLDRLNCVRGRPHSLIGNRRIEQRKIDRPDRLRSKDKWVVPLAFLIDLSDGMDLCVPMRDYLPHHKDELW